MKFFLTITTASILTQSILGDLDYEEPVTFGGLDTASYDFSSYSSDNCNTASASSSADSADVSTKTGGGTSSHDDGGDYSSYGQKYENKYAGDYSKYYNGDNGDGGWDNGNDNGSGKQQQVMCDCTKKAKKAEKDDKSSFDNDVFSKCVNNEFGNNAWTWDHKYLKKYTKESIMEGGTPSTTGIITSTTGVYVGGSGETEKSGLMSGNARDGDVNTHSITHSDYMSYLAIFLMFIGAVLLVTLGLNCFKYSWKAFRLRNYEAIGATTKQTKEKQQKNTRIRLPRKHDNQVYTIGNV